MTIHEVAKKLNLTQDTLRFYEKNGLLGHIARDHETILARYEEP